MSWQLAALNVYLRLVERPYLARETDFVRGRARMEAQVRHFPMPPGARFAEAPVGGLPALRLAAAPAAPVILWLHGGAYCIGSPRTHAAMVAALAGRLGAGAVLPDDRLAPEHPFPAAPEDALAVYAGLLAEGTAPGRIAVGGDSAGGGLVFALLHMALAAGLPMPAAALAFSPWIDLTGGGQSLRTLAWRDVLIPVRRFAEISAIYLAGADPRDPRASPHLGDLAGAPPVLIQASRAEVLRDDARAMAARLEACGVPVTLELDPGLPHVWQIYQGHLPEADRALDRAAAFLRARLEGAGSTPARTPR
jgi:acetyl esterase/lipase